MTFLYLPGGLEHLNGMYGSTYYEKEDPMAKDLMGKTFGRLTVFDDLGMVERPSGGRDHTWEAFCTCGNTVVVTTSALTGTTRSCGCLRRENARKQAQALYASPVDLWRLGVATATEHPLYDVWRAMHSRCTNPSDVNWVYYGQRGISVCSRWSGPEGFVNFVQDMGERPADPEGWTSSKAYWSIDRTDNNGNYEPGNCRWATPSEQTNNRRTKEEMGSVR